MASKAEELSNLAAGHNPGGTAGKRLEFYDDAVRAFESRPAIGWGVGGWSQFYYHEDKRGYPHNLFLEVAVEQGAVGLLVLCLFVMNIFWVAARQRVEFGGRFSFILPVVAYSLSVTMFSGDITDNRCFWMWCGLCIALSRLAGVEENTFAPTANWQALNMPVQS
jgi:O-antigen ligase